MRPFVGKPLLRRLRRSPRAKTLLTLLLILLTVETWHHASTLGVRRPSPPNSDAPFQHGCAAPPERRDGAQRANATVLMLARNSDQAGAVRAVRSLERHFNRWYGYPILFLNNEPWSPEFVSALSANVSSGPVSFDVLPRDMWSFPPHVHEASARKSMARQEARGILHGGQEDYHHMCRFFSGLFHDVPGLAPYKYFWRLEPDAEFTCAITYDPFRHMARTGKRYGYAMALWEVGRTAPGLFGLVDEYKRSRGIGSSEVWKAMLDPAWVPWPVRALFGYASHHTAEGDFYNFCHYWSNFEIADLDFFRSREYRDFFEYLDRSGGFYHERFGDAPIHSLAAALFLKPHELHHFEDFGYKHGDMWVQPHNALGKQLPTLSALDDVSDASLANGDRWAAERAGASGCRCEVREDQADEVKAPGLLRSNIQQTCFWRLGEAIKAP